MRILLIHSDFVEYEVNKKTPVAEPIPEGHKGGRMEEGIAAFMTIEKEDEANPDGVVANAAKTIREMAEKVGTKRVMLYPYAHLSSSLADPKTSMKVLQDLEAELKTDLEVQRSPFGWYKGFTLKCKGHPLSELSRQITADGAAAKPKDDVSDAVKSEEKMRSSWFILEADGKEHPLELRDNKIHGYEFKGLEGLKKFTQYEMAKSRVAKQEPPHIDIMRRLNLVDYEPGSDPGNMRYYPKGRLIKSLLERYVTQKVKETGGMEIESPIMYDFEHPSLRSYMNRFPARQYTIQTPDKKVFLRFAACFGQFLMMHDASASYRNLPLRLYEMTRYSFRVEQRGELAGLRRLRAFTMPDCHSFAADIDMAKSEMASRFELSREVLTGVGLDVPQDLEFAIRITKEFYEQNREFVLSLVKSWGKPALVEMWSERFFYFVMKYEWNFVDALDKASALCTDQIDVENAERYGITYVGSDGQKHFPYILHQSPSGAIERCIYALLERAHMRGLRGEKARLPMWLAPTHIRLIPVKDDFVKDCEELSARLPGRVDIDDRDMTVGKKIRDAEKEWIEYIVVYGDKERASGQLTVRDRKTGKEEPMAVEALGALVDAAVKGFPQDTLAEPKMMSKRVGWR